MLTVQNTVSTPLHCARPLERGKAEPANVGRVAKQEAPQMEAGHWLELEAAKLRRVGALKTAGRQ